MPDFQWPGHPKVAPMEPPRQAPKPSPPAPSREDRRIALEVTAQAFQGDMLVNSFSAQLIIETADKIANYLVDGKVAGK